jgi:hypothetical protein
MQIRLLQLRVCNQSPSEDRMLNASRDSYNPTILRSRDLPSRSLSVILYLHMARLSACDIAQLKALIHPSRAFRPCFAVQQLLPTTVANTYVPHHVAPDNPRFELTQKLLLSPVTPRQIAPGMIHLYL